MRSFWIGAAAAVVIAAIAGIALNSLDGSSAARYSTEATRL